MDAHEFRTLIIRPTLKAINLWSLNGEYLLLGTALAESGLQNLEQDKGPALGVYQMEPGTYKDCLRYLNRADNKLLKERILTACYLECFPNEKALIWHLRFATCMARIKYWMDPKPLPYYKDLEAQADYWKTIYNTCLGSGTVEHYIQAWQRGIYEDA